MKRSSTLFGIVLFGVLVGNGDSIAQTNIEPVGNLSYNSRIANLWGYADEQGNEYALVGVGGTFGNSGGFSVVSLADPTQPEEVFFLPGPASIWREIKVWNDHAYITTEADNGGLVIVDLSPLPQSTSLPSTVFFDPGWHTSHSLFIDENGRLYIHGANEGSGGVIMYDLTEDPMAPVRVGQFDQWYVHDSFARGDTLYAAHILNGFFTIVDVSDPASPVLLGQQTTPNNFTHNVWLDDSGRHLYTTDERTNSYVAAYDVSDPTDIEFMDKLRSDGGSGAIPHNTYWLPGDYLVQSYYTYGVSIYDCSDPSNLVEVGNYDTSPYEGDGFRGAWGVYPYLPSGLLIVSDIETGLHVLQPTYMRGCRLQGQITNSSNGIPVALATLQIVDTDATETTGITGNYTVGTLQPGVYNVSVSAPGFYPTTVEAVVLETGTTVILDIQLDPLPTYPYAGVVRTLDEGTPVPGAQVWIVNGTFTFNTTTAPDGSFSFPGIYDGTYNVDIGAWGWKGSCPADLVVNGGGDTEMLFELERGFADDFALDLGWQITATAPRGVWERGRPSGTIFEEQVANPGADVEGDCRDKAYVTGNSGGAATNADVDDGATTLISPVFDATGMADPHIRYHYWFFDSGGFGLPNDTLTISLNNGSSETVIQRVFTGSAMSQWYFSNIRISDHIEPTSTMRLFVRVADQEATDHLVEAAFDDFSLVPEAFTSMDEPAEREVLSIWPVPTTDRCTVELPGAGSGVVQTLDPLGRVAGAPMQMANGRATIGDGLPAGSYVVRVLLANGRTHTGRFQIVR